MKPMIKRKLDLSKVRTRYEPPTLEEAIFAAQGLTSDIEHQVAIARELTGEPEEEIRIKLTRLRSEPVRSRQHQDRLVKVSPQTGGIAHRATAATQTVVVERRTQRSFSVPPRSAAPTRD